MWVMSCGMRLFGVAVVATGLYSTSSMASVRAQSTPTAIDTRIDMRIDGAPSLVAGLEPRLVRGTTDVTDRYCSDLAIGDDVPLPERRCPDLPDGTYAVKMAGVPDGAIVGWRCGDNLVAGLEDPAALPVITDSYLGNWGCLATVARPGVLLHLDSPDDTFDVAFRRPDGVALDPTCEADSLGDRRRQWCTGFEAGVTYTATGVGVPVGLRSFVPCSPAITAYRDDRGERVDQFRVTARRPLIQCDRAYAFEPLTISVSDLDVADIDNAAPWLSDVVPTVTTLDGTVVGNACVRRGLNPDGVSFSCELVDDGRYGVAVSGLPPGRRFSNHCDPVEVRPVDRPVACSVDVVVGDSDYPPAFTPEPPPMFVPLPDGPAVPNATLDLPATGPDTVRATSLGLLLVIIGGALLATARRHPSEA